MRASKAGTVAVIVWCAVLAGALWIAPVAGDDAYHHGVMAVEQAKCWRHGVLWPRFHPDWNGGTGSFLPAVYSPFALSLDAVLVILTGAGTRAVSLALVAALAAGTFLMAAAGKDDGPSWWLFAVSPYILMNVFSRATVTETWALAAVAGGLALVVPPGIERPREGLAVVGALLLAAGFQPVMLLLVGIPALVTWLVASALRWDTGGTGNLLWGGAAAAATAIFWIPPLVLIKDLDSSTVFSGHYGWRGHFVTNVHGNGQLGPMLLAIWAVLIIVAVATGLLFKRGADTRGRTILTFLLTCLLLASPATGPLWTLPGLRMAQFPWRFLGPASLAAVLLLARFPRPWRSRLTALFLLPLVLLPIDVDGGRPVLNPRMSTVELSRAASIRYGIAPILPSTPGEYAPGFHPLKSLRALKAQEGIEIERIHSSCTSRAYRAAVSKDGDYLFPVQWWPFWDVRVDGRSEAFFNGHGLAGLHLGVGTHSVALALRPSGARWIGGAVSVAGLLVSLLLWWRSRAGDGGC